MQCILWLAESARGDVEALKAAEQDLVTLEDELRQAMQVRRLWASFCSSGGFFLLYAESKFLTSVLDRRGGLLSWSLLSQSSEQWERAWFSRIGYWNCRWVNLILEIRFLISFYWDWLQNLNHYQTIMAQKVVPEIEMHEKIELDKRKEVEVRWLQFLWEGYNNDIWAYCFLSQLSSSVL